MGVIRNVEAVLQLAADRLTEKPIPGEKPVDPARRRRAADMAIFGSREHSQRGSVIQIRADVRNLQERIGSVRRREGADAHFIGTVLLRLWHGRADEVFGFDSFEAFAKTELGLSRTTAYRYVRLAAYATAAEAEWGTDLILTLSAIVDLVRASPKLQKKLGVSASVKQIRDLAKCELPLPGNRVLRLQGVRTIDPVDAEAALALLRDQSGLDPGGLASKADRGDTDELRRAIAGKKEFRGVDVRVRRRGKRRVLQLVVPEGVDLVKLAKELAAVRKPGA